jgi:hypothetical protein
VRGQEHGSAQALDLKSPRGLRVETIPEPAGCKQGERDDHEGHDPAEDEQGLEHTPVASDGPEIRDRNGNEHDRIELRGHRQPEQAEREQVPSAQERGQCADGQRGGKQVVGVE